MRPIDADALDVLTVIGGRTNGKVEFAKAIEEAIKKAPTIDAVPVIRCRDCKYYTGKWCTKYSKKQFDINDICKADNDFCSRAERKRQNDSDL